MTTSAPSKTMFNYFTKLPSKTCIVEETNPRKVAPMFNKQHVEEFHKNKLEHFDAEITLIIEQQQQQQQQQQHHHQQQSKESTNNSGNNINYVTSIKTGQHKPFRLQRKARGPCRARLLQYHEDVRPPYYGSWQKKTNVVTGRRPFNRDDDMFEYDVDSEAEWDIGGPGESLKGDDSEDEEELDDYEIDMKTFVPHGYVSDDEIEVHSDQEENQSSANQSRELIGDENSNVDVEIVAEKGVPAKSENGSGQQQQTQKQKYHYQQNSVANSPAQVQPMRQQTKQEIKPILLGLYYENEQQILSESKIQFLKAFQGYPC